MSPSNSPILLALAFATAAALTQNFTRRVLYTESRVSEAVIQDVVAQGLRLGLLALLALSFNLTASRLFIIVGIAYFSGAFVGLWQIRHSFTRAFDRSVIAQHWKFGNWLGASEVAYMIPHYVAAAILSATLSVAAYGAYRAALQLVHGANVPLRAVDSLLRPRLARDAQEGPQTVSRTVRPVMLVGGIALVAFAALLIILREPLLRSIYGSEYAPYASLLILLAIKPIFDLIREVLTNVLLAYHRTRAIFVRTVVGSVVGIALGGLAILAFGLPASGAISLTGAIASVVWLVWVSRQILERESRNSESVAASKANSLPVS